MSISQPSSQDQDKNPGFAQLLWLSERKAIVDVKGCAPAAVVEHILEWCAWKNVEGLFVLAAATVWGWTSCDVLRDPQRIVAIVRSPRWRRAGYPAPAAESSQHFQRRLSLDKKLYL